jgi:hypothetical protein
MEGNYTGCELLEAETHRCGSSSTLEERESILSIITVPGEVSCCCCCDDCRCCLRVNNKSNPGRPGINSAERRRISEGLEEQVKAAAVENTSLGPEENDNECYMRMVSLKEQCCSIISMSDEDGQLLRDRCCIGIIMRWRNDKEIVNANSTPILRIPSSTSSCGVCGCR